MSRLLEDFIRSLIRTIVNMPIVFFWWSITTLLMMGTERWLDWMHNYLLINENLFMAAGYLALVSWLFSMLFYPSGRSVPAVAHYHGITVSGEDKNRPGAKSDSP